MDETRFWKIIASSRRLFGFDPDRFCDAVRAKLMKLDADEIRSFSIHLNGAMLRANTWDLWGAAYLINGGCSDDGFVYFRCWLISRGRAVFDAATKSPDSLAGVWRIKPGDCDLEGLLYVPAEAHEQVTGNPLDVSTSGEGEPPRGQPWSEGSDDLTLRLPRLSKRFGGWTRNQ